MAVAEPKDLLLDLDIIEPIPNCATMRNYRSVTVCVLDIVEVGSAAVQHVDNAWVDGSRVRLRGEATSYTVYEPADILTERWARARAKLEATRSDHD